MLKTHWLLHILWTITTVGSWTQVLRSFAGIWSLDFHGLVNWLAPTGKPNGRSNHTMRLCLRFCLCSWIFNWSFVWLFFFFSLLSTVCLLIVIKNSLFPQNWMESSSVSIYKMLHINLIRFRLRNQMCQILLFQSMPYQLAQPTGFINE